MDQSTSSVTDLVRAAAGGDEQAWGQIVDRFAGLLWAVARSHRLDHDRAADVVQATWLRLVQSLDRIAEPEALPGWLLTTARREALRVATAHGREVLADGDERPERADPEAAELDLGLLAQERDAVLWGAFGHLGELCRELLRLLAAPEAPPYVEVSALLGIPVGSIGPTRMRCLAKLRELLAQTGYDFGEFAAGGGR